MSSPYGSRVEHKKGTLRDSLHKRAEETLTRDGLENAVICPEDVDRNEWIAVHAVDFFNDISILFGIVHDDCTAESCPIMSAGAKFEFLWIDKQRYRRPTRLPAKIYIDFLLNWLVEQLENESLFPVKQGVPFPPDYEEQVRCIFRRMYRVYAHIWCSHYKIIVNCKCEDMFKFSLKHYLHFVNQFNLVSGSDLRPLSALVNELAPQLAITKAMNDLENSKREYHQQAAKPIAYHQLISPTRFSNLSGDPKNYRVSRQDQMQHLPSTSVHIVTTQDRRQYQSSEGISYLASHKMPSTCPNRNSCPVSGLANINTNPSLMNRAPCTTTNRNVVNYNDPMNGVCYNTNEMRESVVSTQPIVNVRESVVSTQPTLAMRESVASTQPIVNMRDTVPSTQPIVNMRDTVPSTQPTLAMRESVASTSPAGGLRESINSVYIHDSVTPGPPLSAPRDSTPSIQSSTSHKESINSSQIRDSINSFPNSESISTVILKRESSNSVPPAGECISSKQSPPLRNTVVYNEDEEGNYYEEEEYEDSDRKSCSIL